MDQEQKKGAAVELLHPRSLKYLTVHLQALVRGRLWLQVMIAMVVGIAAGIILGPSVGWLHASTAIVVGNWLAFPGQLFLALIQMIVIPLVFASIIRGLAATEDIEQLRKMGVRVVGYFVVTTAIAIVIGVVLALTIKPGLFVDSHALQTSMGAAPPAPAQNSTLARPTLSELPQALLRVLPANPLGSMVQSEMLQVVIFAMIVGIALVMMAPSQSKPLLDLTGSLQEVCMTIVRWAMLLAPLAVFGLLAQLTSRLGIDALLGMAVYVATVLLGLFLMLSFCLAVVYAAARRNPLDFLRAVREVLLLAFSTSSSAAVTPMSIKTAEEKLGVRPSVSQFVIPLGATINMNGTALYQGVAAIFLAQIFGVDVGPGGLLLLIVTAVGASIGAPATPGVGIVIMAMVLTTIGVPASGIALIIGVDRILDMSRTAINVSGDIVAATLMDRWVGGKTPVEDALAAEAEREKVRRSTGEDILVGES